MNHIPIKEQIFQEVEKLTLQQQEQLLRVVRLLRQPAMPAMPLGTPGEALLADMDRYQFEPGELDEMLKVIEEETERIDWDGWR